MFKLPTHERIAVMQATIALTAVLGAVIMGVKDVDRFGGNAATVLSAAIGGYFGLSHQSEKKDKE